MPYLSAISACLLALVGLGLLERFLRGRAWRAVPIRIHVNGTRGKSSVTRLIWSALREAGIPALAKTTGAAPRLLLPDGTERPLKRRGKPNIREQLRTLLLARRAGAQAVVLECMALGPDLQWTAEHSMVRATIGVITNARTDHTEIMGQSLDEIAACLSNTVPFRGTVVVGDARLAEVCARCTEQRGSRLVIADAGAANSWRDENEAIALAVTRQLGIADAVALAGMRRAPADPGDSRRGIAHLAGQPLAIVDARSANDPESFLRTVQHLAPEFVQANSAAKPPVLVYNHRADRPHRLTAFAGTAFAKLCVGRIIMTGDRPAFTTWRTLRRRAGIAPLDFISPPKLRNALATFAPACGGVVFCGNTHGLDVAALLKAHSHG